MRGSPRNYLKDESKIQIGFRSSNENAGAAGHWMAPQVGGNMIKVDNMYLKDDKGKLYKVLEIGDIFIKNKQDNSVVQVISGEMLFGDKGRIECIIEDDQIVTIINGEEKKIVIERR